MYNKHLFINHNYHSSKNQVFTLINRLHRVSLTLKLLAPYVDGYLFCLCCCVLALVCNLIGQSFFCGEDGIMPCYALTDDDSQIPHRNR